jgi:hypothetical protein
VLLNLWRERARCHAPGRHPSCLQDRAAPISPPGATSASPSAMTAERAYRKALRERISSLSSPPSRPVSARGWACRPPSRS